MSPPPQPQPAIDQVWLLEVNDTFSQDQLVTALTSNSISVPTELQQTERNAKNQSPLGDVDGIHVNAKRSQMKRALSQLSLSDAVTISAFQLPSDAVKKQVAVAQEKAEVYADAPASIVAPPKAMAQKLRGNFFARTSPSKMPKTFDELEAMMGVDGQDESDAAAGSNTDAKQPVAVSAVESDEAQRSRTAAEMDQLFPDDEVDSDELRNFLILIRNSVTPLKK